MDWVRNLFFMSAAATRRYPRADTTEQQTRDPRMDYKWTALTVTTVGAFMAALDSSCMTIGLPSVLIDLDATIFHGIWVITGYRLMLTILLVLLGFIVALAIIPRLLRGKTTPKQAQPERPPSSPTYMKN